MKDIGPTMSTERPQGNRLLAFNDHLVREIDKLVYLVLCFRVK